MVPPTMVLVRVLWRKTGTRRDMGTKNHKTMAPHGATPVHQLLGHFNTETAPQRTRVVQAASKN